MSKFHDHLVPTRAQQLDREYPEWAISRPRLRITSARVLARAESILYSDPATDQGLRLRSAAAKVLQRLEDEGPHPVYDALVEELNHDPLSSPAFRDRYVMGSPDGRLNIQHPPLIFRQKIIVHPRQSGKNEVLGELSSEFNFGPEVPRPIPPGSYSQGGDGLLHLDDPVDRA